MGNCCSRKGDTPVDARVKTENGRVETSSDRAPVAQPEEVGVTPDGSTPSPSATRPADSKPKEDHPTENHTQHASSPERQPLLTDTQPTTATDTAASPERASTPEQLPTLTDSPTHRAASPEAEDDPPAGSTPTTQRVPSPERAPTPPTIPSPDRASPPELASPVTDPWHERAESPEAPSPTEDPIRPDQVEITYTAASPSTPPSEDFDEELQTAEPVPVEVEVVEVAEVVEAVAVEVVEEEAVEEAGELSSLQEAAKEMSATEQQYAQFFKDTDTDGSGQLSLDELTAMLKGKGYRGSDKELKELFRMVDASGDKLISYEEFMQAMGVLPLDTHKQALTRQVFRSFDKDDNGQIDRAELKAVMTECGRHLSEQEVDRLMELCDTDKSGTIDYEEFIHSAFGA